MVANHLNGSIVYRAKHAGESYRVLIHKYNETHRWARFGNDLLLGVKADMPTTPAEWQFLPENLSDDFATASIKSEDGSESVLVGSDSWILPRTQGVGSDSFPLSPTECFGIFALLIVALTLVEYWKHASYWIADIIIMLAAGLCGLILLAMVFSLHPTVSLNFQILLLNPIALFALVPMAKGLRNGRVSMWLKVWTACIVIFLIGGALQSYAEGMYFVALSLLFRYIFKIKRFKK